MKTVQDQFNDMLNAGKMPIFELQTGPDSYLVIDLWATDKGIAFAFDEDNKKTYFSSDIEQTGHCYTLLYDEDWSLDSHLEQIMLEILEGYCIPNNIEII